MPRQIRDANLETRTARSRLKVAHAPHYRLIEPGLHLGYRKLASGPGRWVCRRYTGNGVYTVKNLMTRDGSVILADDFSDADGHTVLTFGQAQEAAKAFRPAGAGKSGPFTVNVALDEYLLFLSTNRKTAKEAGYRVGAHIRPILGAVEVAALTADQIRQWLNGLAKSPGHMRTRKEERQRFRDAIDGAHAMRQRRASANRVFTILRAALNRAWREGKIPSNGEWARVKPFENVEAARIRYLSVAEAQRLINACNPDFRKLVIAALQTGARYGELAALEVHDFNPDAGTIAIRTSKTGNPRHVVLTDEGAEFFRQLCAGRAGSELLLCKPDGQPWQRANQIFHMTGAVKRAKIMPPIGFHGLRHTWASLSVMAGVPLMVVGRNLGHSDTRMVEKHYGHLAPSYVAEAIRAGAPRFGAVASNVTPLR